MNLNLARSYLSMAVVQRDCALAFESRAARTPYDTIRILNTLRAQNCRAQMRLAALRMVDHLRPLEAMRELRALGARQVARDFTPASMARV